MTSEKKKTKGMSLHFAENKSDGKTLQPVFWTVGHPVSADKKQAESAKRHLPGAKVMWDGESDVLAWFRIETTLPHLICFSQSFPPSPSSGSDKHTPYRGQLLGPEDTLTLSGEDCQVVATDKLPELACTPKVDYDYSSVTLLVGCVYTSSALVGKQAQSWPCSMLHPVRGGMVYLHNTWEDGVPFAHLDIDMKVTQSSRKSISLQCLAQRADSLE